jgi:hypothetical protein
MKMKEALYEITETMSLSFELFQKHFHTLAFLVGPKISLIFHKQ